MPRGRPKNVVLEEAQPEATTIVVETPSQLEVAQARQAQLLELRGLMFAEGVDSISKLDAILSQVNEEVRKLS